MYWPASGGLGDGIHVLPRGSTLIGELRFDVEVAVELETGLKEVGGEEKAPRAAAAAAIICAEGGVCSMQSRRMIMEGRRSWNCAC